MALTTPTGRPQWLTDVEQGVTPAALDFACDLCMTCDLREIVDVFLVTAPPGDNMPPEARERELTPAEAHMAAKSALVARLMRDGVMMLPSYKSTKRYKSAKRRSDSKDVPPPDCPNCGGQREWSGNGIACFSCGMTTGG